MLTVDEGMGSFRDFVVESCFLFFCVTFINTFHTEGRTLDVYGDKKRIIQEFVPGKQVTLAHVIANPVESLYAKLGLIDARGAIGIFTITPGEAAMIAADVATKAAEVELGFVDRFNGSLLITGEVAGVEEALKGVMEVLCKQMGFAGTEITRS